jgi:hypothetical protein
MKQKIKIGTMILDDNKLGIIINEIKSGTWTEEPLFNWTTSFEIKYADGDVCIMTEESLKRLIRRGKIVVLDDK